MLTSDFRKGEMVLFGRNNGEKTLGRVDKVNRKRLKIEQMESRGMYKSHKVGTIWTVPPYMCQKVQMDTTCPAPALRSEAAILADAERVIGQLSPENLHWDGERSPAAARRAASALRRRFRELENELGHQIARFGDIDGYMPASIGRPARDSGWKEKDRVTFQTRTGATVTGRIMRVNRKTVSVKPDGPGTKYWRVGPHLLSLAA